MPGSTSSVPTLPCAHGWRRSTSRERRTSSARHSRPGCRARVTAPRGGPSVPPAPAEVKDETQQHSGVYLTPYERTKAEAHQVALAMRGRGLPLVIGMPNAVSGANDHSVFGYLLRLYLLHAMPPLAWSPDVV